VADYARNRGFRWQRPEVQFYEYRIDLYGFSKKQNQTVAIELKLTKWQRAVEQALIYQLCSDLVYIAVPYATSLRVDANLLQEHGIGLVAVRDNGKCRTIIEAVQSFVVRHDYRTEYINTLKGMKKWLN
jgi:hypothetical protein